MQTKYTVVIDPLIDGMTGAQSNTTRSMGARLSAMMREQYPQYDVQPFSAATVAKNPLVLIGTFTGVNAERKTAGIREAYRICFALADLKTGKIVEQRDSHSRTPRAWIRHRSRFTVMLRRGPRILPRSAMSRPAKGPKPVIRSMHSISTWYRRSGACRRSDRSL